MFIETSPQFPQRRARRVDRQVQYRDLVILNTEIPDDFCPEFNTGIDAKIPVFLDHLYFVKNWTYVIYANKFYTVYVYCQPNAAEYDT